MLSANHQFHCSTKFDFFNTMKKYDVVCSMTVRLLNMFDRTQPNRKKIMSRSQQIIPTYITNRLSKIHIKKKFKKIKKKYIKYKSKLSKIKILNICTKLLTFFFNLKTIKENKKKSKKQTI